MKDDYLKYAKQILEIVGTPYNEPVLKTKEFINNSVGPRASQRVLPRQKENERAVCARTADAVSDCK